jgi:hypothetical protein
MAKTFIIQENESIKYYHLSIAKGSYIIRSFENNSEIIVDKGKEKDLDEKVWSNYVKKDKAPYHTIKDIAFWCNFLQKPQNDKEKEINRSSHEMKIITNIGIIVGLVPIIPLIIRLIWCDFSICNDNEYLLFSSIIESIVMAIIKYYKFNQK